MFVHNVHLVRKEQGRQLAREHPTDEDIVISVPDSGNSAAMRFAEESGITYEMGNQAAALKEFFGVATQISHCQAGIL